MKPSYLFFYLCAASLLGFLLMGMDKRRAKRNRWRISEKSLFLVALLGGAVGSTLGMHTFHHKTKHWYFKLGFPALAMLQLVLLTAYLYWFAFLRT